MPKKDDDKKKKQKKQKIKLPKKKKGEKTPFQYPYGPYPPRPPEPDKRDLVEDEVSNLGQPMFEDHIKEDQCNPGVSPTLIKEVYMPPKAPTDQINTLVESALVYQNNAHYEQAMDAFTKAEEMWKKIRPLDAVEQLYFILSKASVQES